MASSTTRSARIEARTTPYVLDVLRRAAHLEGRSLSDFVVSAAEKAARETIEAHHIIRVSAPDFDRIVDLVENPPEPTPAARRARDHHKRLFGS